MQILRILSLSVALLFGAATALANGGTLELRTRLPEDVYRIWPSRIQTFTDPTHATVVLDKGIAEDVFVFESQGEKPTRFVFTKSKPYRLFIDLNGDGRCQPGEIHTPSQSILERRRIREYQLNHFENVSLPVLIQGTRRFLTANVNFHVFPTSLYSLSVDRMASLWWVQTHYEGTLALGGVEYPARLGFRSPLPDGRLVNEVIILDSSPDGSFEPDIDLWFSGNGVAWLNDKYCAIETIFSGSKARVSIMPYTGPTGCLKVEGEGYIERLSLAIAPPGATEAPAYEIAPPHQESRLYRLPTGRCAPGTVLRLKPGKDSEVYFEYVPGDESPEAVEISADATASLPLAGPLTGKAILEVLLLRGKVALAYEYANASGLPYHLAWYREYIPREPLYRVLSRQGKEVVSGRFSYG